MAAIDPALQPNLALDARAVVYRAAGAAAARAAETSEQRANALLHLAGFEAQGTDAARIEATLRKAIEAAPVWYAPRLPLARLLASTRRTDEAKQQARQALELSAGKVEQARLLCEQLDCRPE